MEQNNNVYEVVPFLFASFPAARIKRNINLIDKTLLKMKDIIDKSNTLKIKRVPIFITSGETIIPVYMQFNTYMQENFTKDTNTVSTYKIDMDPITDELKVLGFSIIGDIVISNPKIITK